METAHMSVSTSAENFIAVGSSIFGSFSLVWFLVRSAFSSLLETSTLVASGDFPRTAYAPRQSSLFLLTPPICCLRRWLHPSSSSLSPFLARSSLSLHPPYSSFTSSSVVQRIHHVRKRFVFFFPQRFMLLPDPFSFARFVNCKVCIPFPPMFHAFTRSIFPPQD